MWIERRQNRSQNLPPCSCLEICVLQREAVFEPYINTLNEQRRCQLSKASLKMRRSQNSWCFCWKNSGLGVGGRKGSWGGLSWTESLRAPFSSLAEAPAAGFLQEQNCSLILRVSKARVYRLRWETMPCAQGKEGIDLCGVALRPLGSEPLSGGTAAGQHVHRR